MRGVDYTLYQAASGDYCVTVESFDKEAESFNLGSREKALEFILSEYLVTDQDDEDYDTELPQDEEDEEDD